MTDRNIVHCREGGKVIIEGDRVEIHLAGPLVLKRKSFASMWAPREEVKRTLQYTNPTSNVIEGMLEEAFRAVPMTPHRGGGE